MHAGSVQSSSSLSYILDVEKRNEEKICNNNKLIFVFSFPHLLWPRTSYTYNIIIIATLLTLKSPRVVQRNSVTN